MIDEVRIITKDIARQFLPKRENESNKGTYGKVLNIAGSQFYQGAAYLSSVSALKSGAGLVTLSSIENVINNVVSMAPCVTFYPIRAYKNQCIAGDAFSQIKEIVDRYNVVSIGCGLSDLPALSSFMDDFIRYFSDLEIKLVFDADALNVLSASDIKKFPRNSVITPHPMELSRLINVPVSIIQEDRLRHARCAAGKFDCTVVLKGYKTLVALPNGLVYENYTGNSALAKAGSGDVLTGMISGFAAQGLSIEKSSILSVYLHGLCGELASVDKTEYSVLANELVDYLPVAIKNLLEVL